MDDYVGVAARSTLFVFVATIVGNLFGYGARAFLTRTITPAQFGLFFSVMTFYMFIALPTDLGFGSALTRFIAKFRAKNQFTDLFSSIVFVACLKLVLSLIIAGIIYLTAPWLAINYFKAPEALIVVRISALILVLSAFSSVLSSTFHGFKKM